jgi:hypothetical protein
MSRPRRDQRRLPEYHRDTTPPSSQLQAELRISWCVALDAAQTALRAANAMLPAGELHERSTRLTSERARTMNLLDLLRATGREPTLTRS